MRLLSYKETRKSLVEREEAMVYYNKITEENTNEKNSDIWRI